MSASLRAHSRFWGSQGACPPPDLVIVRAFSNGRGFVLVDYLRRVLGLRGFGLLGYLFGLLRGSYGFSRVGGWACLLGLWARSFGCLHLVAIYETILLSGRNSASDNQTKGEKEMTKTTETPSKAKASTEADASLVSEFVAVVGGSLESEFKAFWKLHSQMAQGFLAVRGAQATIKEAEKVGSLPSFLICMGGTCFDGWGSLKD
jgi:hypothetical protein